MTAGDVFEPRRTMSAVVLPGGGGFGKLVSRKAWLPVPLKVPTI